MSVHRALAPAKVNLGLFLGPLRASDGRHELVSVMQSISLADELALESAPPAAAGDEVVCPGVPGPPGENLAAAALRAFRADTGWDAPPLRLRIEKRIPVAAGLGGGSADAAAALRLAAHAAGLADEPLLRRLAQTLGADVPAQISPGRWLASGAGDQLEPLAAPSGAFEVLLLPLAASLSTAAVYAQADRLELARPAQELRERHDQLAAAFADGAPLPPAPELLHNDLQQAALSLCPQIAEELVQAHTAGAPIALVSGSGPTVIGLFPHPAQAAAGAMAADGPTPAERAAAALRGRVPAPICARPVDAAFARAVTLPARTGGRR